MRNVLCGVFVLAIASPAFADDIGGTYDVKYEEMGSNCNPPPVALVHGQLTITLFAKKNSLAVNIDTIPEMAGVPAKGGKVNAKTTKTVATTVQGLDANYSIAGKLEDGGVLHVVLVAEYIKHADKKPYCTQSWNVTGLKADKKSK